MDRWARLIVVIAALSGLMAVAAGAFGAHAAADPAARAWLQTAGQYQMVHALAALACVALGARIGRAAAIAAWLFLAGGLVFAGSLDAMAVGGPRALGAVTPVGGVLLLFGWAALAYGAVTRRTGD
jgi:uncharacterized membrane protein YgdD (TMEM256/DUF423 family)